MPFNFSDRHNGPRAHEVKEMLAAIGVQSMDELIGQTVPSDIILQEPLKLDPAMSEHQYLDRLQKIASKNKMYRSMIGLGFYGTASPAVITRNILAFRRPRKETKAKAASGSAP